MDRGFQGRSSRGNVEDLFGVEAPPREEAGGLFVVYVTGGSIEQQGRTDNHLACRNTHAPAAAKHTLRLKAELWSMIDRWFVWSIAGQEEAVFVLAQRAVAFFVEFRPQVRVWNQP